MCITQAVPEDVRSVKMSLMNCFKFECANTTCLPFINITTQNSMKCQMYCLSQIHCRAASFHRSTSNCEVFTDMSNQNVNMVADMDTVSVNVISGTRFPPEPTTTSTTTTTTTTTSRTTTTSTTTTTTATTTTTTVATTTICPAGYVPTSSGTCVNTLLDFNNCGSVGYVCPSTNSSCSGGTCTTRSVQLVGAVAVSALMGSNFDDSTGVITLPLSITLYNYSSNSITVTSNGVLCLGSCSNSYSATSLPSASFAGPTVFGLWTDLYIYAGTVQGIYYGVSGSAPNRTITFEFMEGTNGNMIFYNQFQIIFYENLPNIVKCFYIVTNCGTRLPTVGVQQSGTGPQITYSAGQLNPVAAGTTITFNTNTGTYT
ncbi:unnamed protein product [Adineta steineri]|uniref:Apple domain-containing protein n=1 Tax=Adineta steineri TaxID=433720 RepID=A0A819Z1C9_9BILA|nr:unnamed protein product [Adineta steineri]